MKPIDILRAILYPLTESRVLAALLVFWLLVLLAGAAGAFGIWLAILVVPAVFRYQMLLLEARARERQPEIPGPEFFHLTDNLWSLFPVVVVVATGWASFSIMQAAGATAALVFVAVCGLIYPAILSVLAITHSPAQSVNPKALFRFVSKCRYAYLIAPIYLVISGYLILQASRFDSPLVTLVEMFFVFSLHSLIGSVVAPHNIIDDVYVPAEWNPGEGEVIADIEKSRSDILTHSYGILSRGNRDGGFRYILDWIEKDADPIAAWSWFFERMLTWENKEHALFFAQHYIHDMLQHGENVPALKVIMRCRLIDETFKPRIDDLQGAIAAAEASGNIELATVLKRS